MAAAKKSETATLTRKERERLEHRREILEAAERVFVRNGYHEATVGVIAKEAQFAAGTLYNFFKNKEDLYVNVIDKVIREFMDLFEPRVAVTQDPVAAIGELIRLRLTHFEEHRGFFRVLFETSPGRRVDPAKSFHPDSQNLRNHYLETVSGIFQRGIQQKQFEALDPLYMTLCLEGVINACISYWAEREPEEPLETRIEKMTETFVGRIRKEKLKIKGKV
jgi:TetR/AcrR family transcriptional regulator